MAAMHDSRRTSRKRDDLTARLARHYTGQRPDTDPAKRQALAAAMVAAAERVGDNRARALPPFPAFVAAQARFIGPHVWAAHLALVALAALVCVLEPGGPATSCAVSLLGAAAVLVEAPAFLASKANGVAELEYACTFDHRSVLAARMTVLGCTGALALTCTAVAVPVLARADALTVLVHACLPYFLGCIGCLEAARRAPASSVLAVALGLAALIALAVAAAAAFPQAYADAATGVWGLAALAALAGLVREARLLLDSAAQGLDALGPVAC